jgi:hypothetical protein
MISFILWSIETKYHKFILEITKLRNQLTLEKFVNKKFYEDTHFTHDD